MRSDDSIAELGFIFPIIYLKNWNSLRYNILVDFMTILRFLCLNPLCKPGTDTKISCKWLP